MLKSFLISSGVLPLIMLATVLQPTSLQTIRVNNTRERCRSIIVQQGLDIQVIGGENNFEQHFLIDSDKLLVPLANVRCALACLILTCF